MKLTDEARAAIRALVDARSRELVRCPWNPFPADSPWGLQIDQGYRRDLAGDRRQIGRRMFRPVYTDLTDEELEAAGDECREHFATSTLVSSSAEL